nr:hypothetical protein [Tanacetum cinerariifolium]
MPANGTYFVEAVRALDTHRTPIQKQPETLLCLFEMDLFSLIRAPNPTKVKTGSRPRAPHEVPLLTLTATRVIEIDEPAAATDSSGVPSAVEKSPLDFANEDGASDQGTTAPEVPSPEDVPATAAPKVGQSEGAVAAEPHGSRWPSTLSDPDPLSFADAPSHHPVNVAQSSQGVDVAGDPESENVSSPAEVGSPGSVYQPEWGVTNGGSPRPKNPSPGVRNKKPGSTVGDRGRYEEGFRREECWADALQQQVSREETLKAAFEEYKKQQDQLVEQRCAEMDAHLDALSLDFDEELYPHMLTAIAGRMWVIGHGLCLAMMKCAESLEMRQAFVDVESARVAKEAEAKFAAALQSLKDLKYPLLDQLEGLKDAPMDVIIAALYLESDTGRDAPQFIRDLRPSSSQLAIPVYSEVRDPRNPWAFKEEIKLSDAIAANISCAEKKKKCRIVCRTHGVDSAHHARSDGVSVSVPTVVPQGLALLLVDAATQTDLEDA